ncbi:UDP-glucuronosyltransferase 2C1 [Harpegnathos saltator]|uniref:UDP-glucuronosyltransferase n=1 Tax=Harpegnathos saltator TaxID=610380 RepID=E2BQV6_HARSA|nr:UDP-glucuronosyltransferase 2C1 [Harpegnathos saltator]EFN81910.1 UDP-glucuronosyltransferase 2C1 [Harpegnathos saltator]
MKYFQYLFSSLLLLTVLPIQGYRILCVFPYNGKSHFQVTEALCKALAEHGHQIDMISHFPSKNRIANYTDIVNLLGTRRAVTNNISLNEARQINTAVTFYIATVFGGDLCSLMGNAKMQRFIKNPPNDPPYDLVITEYFGSSCYFGFGRLLNIPIIGIVASLEYAFMNEVMGNPTSSSFFPGILVEFAGLPNFWQRLVNTLENLIQPRIFNYYSSSQTDDMRKYLRQDMPDVREIEKDIALLFVNSHYSFHGTRPVIPSFVEIGGLHIEMDKSQLTPELQEWVDNADDGVVYFTLGSLVNIETMPNSSLLGLYESFRKIAPIKVLMKIANKDLLPPGLPSNVVTLPWIPQMAVLRHHNTRVFISHGGLMGSLEAFYHGVPVIGIPLFADQYRNINVFIHKGMGVKLRYEDLSEKTMDAALNTVLNNPNYMEVAKREALHFKDRPMTAREVANFWTEYVIRNGPNMLRSPTMDMPWWQTNLIDVYGFIMACIVIIIYFLTIVVKFAMSILLKDINIWKTRKLKEY